LLFLQGSTKGTPRAGQRAASGMSLVSTLSEVSKCQRMGHAESGDQPSLQLQRTTRAAHEVGLQTGWRAPTHKSQRLSTAAATTTHMHSTTGRWLRQGQFTGPTASLVGAGRPGGTTPRRAAQKHEHANPGRPNHTHCTDPCRNCRQGDSVLGSVGGCNPNDVQHHLARGAAKPRWQAGVHT